MPVRLASSAIIEILDSSQNLSGRGRRCGVWRNEEAEEALKEKTPVAPPKEAKLVSAKQARVASLSCRPV
jgi:hypothetical protein